MTTKTKDMAEELKSILGEARKITDAAEAEGRDLTGDDQAQIKSYFEKATELKGRIEKAQETDKMTAALAELEGVEYVPNQPKQAPVGHRDTKGMSLGQAFTESAEFKDLLSQRANGDHFGQKQQVSSRPVGFKELLFTGADRESAGGLIQNDYRGLQLGFTPFERPLTLRQLLSSSTTNSDTIEYAYIAGVDQNAAFTPEATLTDGTSGTKPQSGFTFERQTTTVKTIANWAAITKRALADVGQVRAMIDQFLRYGIEEEIDRQIIDGDGTGENLLGLNNISGTQTLAATGDDLQLLRRAKTRVRLGARTNANAILIHPEDREEIDLMQDGNLHYYMGGPVAAGGNTTMWGLPVVESEVLDRGTAWVGDFTKAVIYDRQQASIAVTDSHANFFVRNLVAILAETRLALAFIQPAAFVQVELSTSGS
ncbi:phage major capsid protein [Nocardiopsis sp. NPDC007018]|uniref:phage major capsid protein n=1 Tax=Nocardiopsis sp. NPDC007018 TaxID=3155721 RepID=UPI00340F981F